MRFPVEPMRVTSPFGPRDTGIERASTFHKGIDIGRDFTLPYTYIKAVARGIVTANYWNDYRGWVITIKHDNTFTSLYQHLRDKCSLAVGTQVEAGEVIGIMGNTSNRNVLKIATHLHFELRKNGVPIDPMPYLGGDDLTKEETLALIKEVLEGKETKVSSYAKEAWNGAANKGITDGTRPGGYCTREQVIVMLGRNK